MVDIYDLTFNTLSFLGYPVVKQGDYKEGDILPDTFLTYFLVSDEDKTHYDNKPASILYRVRIALYSKEPDIAQQANKFIKEVMTGAGYLRAGGRDLPTDPSTGHKGYSVDYKYLDMEGFE